MKTIEKIIKSITKDREFRAIDIAKVVFPNHDQSDTEGRHYNRGVSTVARLLRKIKGITEDPYGVFYAPSEYF